MIDYLTLVFSILLVAGACPCPSGPRDYRTSNRPSSQGSLGKQTPVARARAHRTNTTDLGRIKWAVLDPY